MTSTPAAAAREACRETDGRFGEQHLADPGSDAVIADSPSTVLSLIQRELVPTLGYVRDEFDVEALGMWLRDQGLILTGSDGRPALPFDLAGNPDFQAKVRQLMDDAETAAFHVCPDNCSVCTDPSDDSFGDREPVDRHGWAAYVNPMDGL